MKKASGGNWIPSELFQILKMMLLKCCSQYVSKLGKLSSGHRTRKGQFSFRFQRKAVSNNAQTTVQLCSFHMLARLCSKSFKLGFTSMRNWEFSDVQTGFQRDSRSRAQTANIFWIIEKTREFQKNICCYTEYAKNFDCVNHNKLENS